MLDLSPEHSWRLLQRNTGRSRRQSWAAAPASSMPIQCQSSRGENPTPDSPTAFKDAFLLFRLSKMHFCFSAFADAFLLLRLLKIRFCSFGFGWCISVPWKMWASSLRQDPRDDVALLGLSQRSVVLGGSDWHSGAALSSSFSPSALSAFEDAFTSS